MQKLYSRSSPSGQVNKNMVPKQETITFILNYSKALRILEYQNLKLIILSPISKNTISMAKETFRQITKF